MNAARADQDFQCQAIAIARAAGNHPFGAILAGPDGAIVLEAGAAYWAETQSPRGSRGLPALKQNPAKKRSTPCKDEPSRA